MMKKRQVWLDVIRCFAILCVVLCHSAETCYRPILLGEEPAGLSLWLRETSLFLIGRLGVPLFLAITGALLLGRTYDHATAFYKRSLLPLFLTTEVWIFLNYLFCGYFQNKGFRWIDLIYEMLFLKESSLSHMWYMPTILGCYVAVPFLARALAYEKHAGEWKLIGILGLIAFFVIPTINVFLTEAVTSLPSISLRIDTGFWGGCYGFYLVSGYLIAHKGILKRFHGFLIAVVFSGSFLLTLGGQYFLYSRQYYESTRLLWYTNIFVFLMGMTLFELLRRFAAEGTLIENLDKKNILFHRVVEDIARCSFGIYILHKLILVLCQKYLPLENTTALGRIGILFAAGFFGSLLLLLPFRYLFKKAGRLLFHIK